MNVQRAISLLCLANLCSVCLRSRSCIIAIEVFARRNVVLGVFACDVGSRLDCLFYEFDCLTTGIKSYLLFLCDWELQLIVRGSFALGRLSVGWIKADEDAVLVPFKLADLLDLLLNFKLRELAN